MLCSQRTCRGTSPTTSSLELRIGWCGAGSDAMRSSAYTKQRPPNKDQRLRHGLRTVYSGTAVGEASAIFTSLRLARCLTAFCTALFDNPVASERRAWLIAT